MKLAPRSEPCDRCVYLSPFSVPIPTAGHERRWVVAVALAASRCPPAWCAGLPAGAMAGAFSCFNLYGRRVQLRGADHGLRAGLYHDPARLCAQAESCTAERREGRKASQVLAESRSGYGLCVASMICHDRTIFLLAMAACFPEAAADTVSSEVGQAFGEKARLITNWHSVPAGTDGGVSLIGTTAGIAAAERRVRLPAFSGRIAVPAVAISIGVQFLGNALPTVFF